MKLAALIARLLLGLVFTVFGLNGFLQFIPAPPPPGDAGAFAGILMTSHYYVVVFGVQLLAGIFLLTNQFVPLALTLLGPILVNILTFHVTLLPAGLAPGLFATILWVFLVIRLHAHFEPLLARRSIET